MGNDQTCDICHKSGSDKNPIICLNCHKGLDGAEHRIAMVSLAKAEAAASKYITKMKAVFSSGCTEVEDSFITFEELNTLLHKRNQSHSFVRIIAADGVLIAVGQRELGKHNWTITTNAVSPPVVNNS